jgi:cytochrome c oxidase cbb3-type subunit IV
MDIGLVGGISTAVSMVAFIAVVIWAMNSKRRADFERTAQMPLEEDVPS